MSFFVWWLCFVLFCFLAQAMRNSEKPVKFSFVLKTSRSITLKTTVVTAFVMAFTRWYSQTRPDSGLGQVVCCGRSIPCCCDETSPVLRCVTSQSLLLTQVALNKRFVGVSFWPDVQIHRFGEVKAALSLCAVCSRYQSATSI